MNIREANAAVAYIRVSTDEQATDAYGLESQERACREFCKQRGWIVVTVFRDAGVSGWADVERPQFRCMMAAIRKNKRVNLVFYDYSRFGRNTEKALRAFRELDKLGVLSIAADNPGIDCRTAAGRTARRDELSKAEDFSDKNSEKTSARMKAAFEEGRFCRPAPLGYKNTGAKLKGQPNIVPDEQCASLIRKAMEMVASGNNRPADVLRAVTAMGLMSKSGKPLKLHSFLKILRNPIFIGKLQSKKWRTTVQGQHEATVDERIFRNVQLVLSGKKTIAAPYNLNRADFPLRRFLRCSECGTPLTGSPSKSETGKKYDYYRCYKCHAVKSTPTNKVDGEFLEMLKRLRPDPKLLVEFPAILKEEWRKRTGDSAALVRKLRAELQERRESQRKLLAKYLNDDKNILPYFEEMNGRFEEEIAILQSQIAEADVEKATFEQLWELSKSLLVDISTAWQKANVSQKQRVQNVLFPNGLKYHPEKGILNSGNDCLFNQLEDFVSGKFSLARPERFELPVQLVQWQILRQQPVILWHRTIPFSKHRGECGQRNRNLLRRFGTGCNLILLEMQQQFGICESKDFEVARCRASAVTDCFFFSVLMLLKRPYGERRKMGNVT